MAMIQVVVQSIAGGLAIAVVEELIRAATTGAAKRAGAGPTVVRDIGTAFRLVAVVAIISAVLRITGVASEFTALTFSGIAALACPSRLRRRSRT